MGALARRPFVTAGLLALPWTQADPGRRTPARWDCGTCLEGPGALDEGVRAFMHCGFMPREKWPPGENDLPLSLGPFPYTADVCPGWLVRQPAVIEGARAYSAHRERALPLYDPHGLNVVWETVEAAHLAFSAHEQEQLRRVTQGGAR